MSNHPLVLMRLFSSSVLSQALLSAASLGVGLLLIRSSTDEQYALFVLVSGVLILLGSLQSAFLGPQLVERLSRLDRPARHELTGSLYRTQRRYAWGLVGLGILASLLLYAGGVVSAQAAALVAAGAAAGGAAVQRGYLRLLLLAYHRAFDTLKSDLWYAALLVAGALAALVLTHAALAVIVGMALAALVAQRSLFGALQRHEPLRLDAAPLALSGWLALGTWSVAGAAVHWAFSQGYNYVVAGQLDMRSVAAIAAVRMLLMPVNLISVGIGSLMLPFVTLWLRDMGAARTWQRLLCMAGGVALLACVYILAVWLLRDWIFLSVLRKSFEHRDTLLVLWSLVFVVMTFRDQLVYLAVARQRFQALTGIGLLGAGVALTTSYVGMHYLGAPGAVIGVLVGELLNLSGIVALGLRERAVGVALRGAEATP